MRIAGLLLLVVSPAFCAVPRLRKVSVPPDVEDLRKGNVQKINASEEKRNAVLGFWEVVENKREIKSGNQTTAFKIMREIKQTMGSWHERQDVEIMWENIISGNNPPPSIVPGLGWSEFTLYSPCDATCKKYRLRFCINSDPAACDSNYPSGVEKKWISCTVDECNAPVDGHWGRWTAWSACSKTCGDGTQTRTRVCDDPAPKNGGSACVGDSSQTQACKIATCWIVAMTKK
ncbi:semaphorin-5B [Nematostella vectensis]|uniref:semaphorin-5B n=1 Tax=Nematostella vectensis TaxID=45351 RepID=UPI0020779582|nr:semaphorin-5B [Nematostella vectensis]